VDDGLGFHDPNQYSFDKLLENKRFGMAGMYERAAIIGAHISIDTEPEQGTTLTVQWRQSYRPSAI